MFSLNVFADGYSHINVALNSKNQSLFPLSMPPSLPLSLSPSFPSLPPSLPPSLALSLSPPTPLLYFAVPDQNPVRPHHVDVALRTGYCCEVNLLFLFLFLFLFLRHLSGLLY